MEPDDPLSRIPREAGDQLDERLRKTETPGHRLYAAAALSTIMLDGFTKGLQSGTLGKGHIDTIKSISEHTVGLFKNPPSTYVELRSGLYQFLEQARNHPDLTDAQREIIPKAQNYLHEMAFSPPEGYLDSQGVKTEDDLRQFAAFVEELNAESDRGAALVGAALVDSRLEGLLRAHFLDEEIADALLKNSATAPLRGFSSRINLCYALGLITQVEYDECEIVRDVRNRFAHRLHGLKFEDQQIRDWCRNLKSMPHEQWGGAKQRFINSVITLCMVLWFRSAHTRPLKAQAPKFSWHLAFGK